MAPHDVAGATIPAYPNQPTQIQEPGAPPEEITMQSLRLVSFDLCPFVQRSTIALEEKGVPYEIEYIDLADKPDWFLKISPHGRVPVLRVDDTTLFESTVILEYLDETRAPRLHPEDPLERARDRAWFSVADAVNSAVYRMMIAADRDGLTAHAETLKTHLAKLEEQIAGPLWRGEAFTAMDAVAYPGLQRAVWLGALYPELELMDDVPKVAAWEKALADRPSVKRSAVPDLRERFEVAIQKYGAVHREGQA